MKLVLACLAVLGVASPLALAGCTSNPLDTRPQCVEVVVNEASAQNTLGDDGAMRKTVEVTLSSTGHGLVGSLKSETGSLTTLSLSATRTEATVTVLRDTRYTAQMLTSKDQSECNPVFMVH